jgi:hypothetical protein
MRSHAEGTDLQWSLHLTPLSLVHVFFALKAEAHPNNAVRNGVIRMAIAQDHVPQDNY